MRMSNFLLLYLNIISSDSFSVIYLYFKDLVEYYYIILIWSYVHRITYESHTCKGSVILTKIKDNFQFISQCHRKRTNRTSEADQRSCDFPNTSNNNCWHVNNYQVWVIYVEFPPLTSRSRTFNELW